MPHAFFKLFKPERAIVARRGEPEAVFNKHILARLIARIHAAYLRDGDMRLVYDGEEVGASVFSVWKIGKKCVRRLARASPVKVAGIILNTACVAKLADEREVVKRSALQSLMLKRLLFSLKFCQLLFKFYFDVFYRTVSFFLACDEMLGGKDKNRFRF